MKKITPFIWFDNQAEEAMNYYFSIFRNSKLLSSSRYGDSGPGPKGQLLVASFELEDMQLSVINGGPHYQLNPAFSLSIDCTDQQEVDYYWEKLGDGGKYMQCGWLTDKFGVTWQVVPRALPRLLGDKDKAKAARVMKAMMQMVKLDVQGLEDAAASPS
ncbi:MAG: VOC family protein [Chitinophagaceae bacterium]|nr:MAG: VOC family protein [Chitinophagaceae bacterium]